jgi:hypothetical protein
VPGAKIIIDGFECRRDLLVTPLEGYDVILGKPWLTQYNPDVDWTANAVTITLAGTVHCLSTPVSASHREETPGIQLLSGIQLRGAVHQGEDVYLVHITAQGDIVQDVPNEQAFVPPGDDKDGMPGQLPRWLPFSELHTVAFDEGPVFADHFAPILERYASVFAPLPDGLPPKRAVDHKIELEPGTAPPFKSVFKMSVPELQEL